MLALPLVWVSLLLAAEPSGRSFESLRVEQRRLVEDWFARLSKTTGKPIDLRNGYNNTALSARTTFDGVTHALLQTTLTSQDGKPLGTALDLVARVNEVAGRILDAQSDENPRLLFACTIQARPARDDFARQARFTPVRRLFTSPHSA